MYRLVLTGEVESVDVGRLRRIPVECLDEHVAAPVGSAAEGFLMASRNPNRASTVYLGAERNWHGRVTVGYREDGSLDRRHVRGKSKGVVVAKVRVLERQRDRGPGP